MAEGDHHHTQGSGEATMTQAPEPIYVDLNPDAGPAEIPSLCMNCHEQGTTRLMLTKIPFFKEVIVMAFDCPHCGYRNQEVQSGGVVAEKGMKITYKITEVEDMDLQVVKSDSATVSIPELQFEIPPNTQKGVITNVEGLIEKAASDLEGLQPLRRAQDENIAAQIDEFISKIRALKDVKEPFTLIIDDPAGNSYLENPMAPKDHPRRKVVEYNRNVDQLQQLGLITDDDAARMREEQEAEFDRGDVGRIGRDEVMTFHQPCTSCGKDTDVRMKLVDIPYFKEVVLFAQNCDHCGYKSNEVKAGGGIEPKGRKITLKITNEDDLARDILKGPDASVEIPEIGMYAGPGTLGGKFTTIEGLLDDFKENLGKANPFGFGDSAAQDQKETKTKFDKLFSDLEKIKEGNTPFTLILDDMAGNSHVQNLYAPDPDPEMTIEEYERSPEQNIELGVADMKTENYEDYKSGVNALKEDDEEEQVDVKG
eukprot:Clim_evm18s34 gene=Clim_evmTU18s34